MKLWEVLKALEDDPKKKFKCSIGGKTYIISTSSTHGHVFYNLTSTDCKGIDISDLPQGGFDGNFTLKTDWQEIKQPVPWQEAIEAFLNGKEVRCHLYHNDFYYEKDKRETNPIKDNTGQLLTPAELIDGTWYIED